MNRHNMARRAAAYGIEPTAPPREWSPLVHGGRTVCVSSGEAVVNLPVEAFRGDDVTLADVLRRKQNDSGAIVATARVAGLLLRPPAVTGGAKRKRAGDAYVEARRDVERATFTLPCDIKGGEFGGKVMPRCVFLIEELKGGGIGTLAGVRLWKVFVDRDWRESRALGLAMEDDGSAAPHTPAELLHLYLGFGGTCVTPRSPLLPSVDDWLAHHSPSGDWAARTLLRADEQRVVPYWGGKKDARSRESTTPSRLHALSPERVLNSKRAEALTAGTLENSVRHRQQNPQSYRHDATDASDDEDGEPRELRFPSAVTVHGIQPHANPLAARLPISLLHRIQASPRPAPS